jgi:low temperature requirement protein LtrA
VDEEPEQRVTNLELFFDLVFVFGITQVTALMAHEPTWTGLAKGMLVLAALWQAWVAYAWLTNEIDPDEDAARLTVFAAMGAMLVAALAVPGALGTHATLFATAYLLVRAIHIVLYLQRAGDPGVHDAVRRLALPVLTAPVILLAASALHGEVQRLVWVAALVLDYGGVFATGLEGWRVSPSHFVERHQLVIIIALGESIVAVGAGSPELSALVVIAALLGFVVAAALWWAYFDVVALVAAKRFARATGRERAAIARDSYSYLHLPMVAGIILLALGVEKVLGHVSDPLETVPAIALCGGVALYLAGHIAFRLRNVRSLNRQRLVVMVLLLVLIWPATQIAALATLAIEAALIAALIAYEAMHFREARTRVRRELGGHATS